MNELRLCLNGGAFFMTKTNRIMVCGLGRSHQIENVCMAVEGARAGVTNFVFMSVQNNERAMGAEALVKAKTYENPVFICGSLYLYVDLKGEGNL